MIDPVIYVTLKYVVAIVLFIGGLVSIYWGRRRQNPFYVLWSIFLLVFGVFQIIEGMNFHFGVLDKFYAEGAVYADIVSTDFLLFRILQVFQALAFILLFAASLEQSMIVPPRASRIIAASLTVLALYFVVIPLEKTVFDFGSLTISIFGILFTEFYGFIYGFIVLCSSLLLIPVIVRYTKTFSASKNKRIFWKMIITIFLSVMLIGLAFITTVKRKVVTNGIDENAFAIFEIVYSFVVVSVVALYQSQSVSHGIQTILIVDREGNPLLGYSPFRKRRISFEEKIIAASGYLAGLFHFIQDYVATASDDEFKEIKTTSSKLSFYSGVKVFVIIQTRISGKLLDKSSNLSIGEIDKLLANFEANQMPNEGQINQIIKILDKNFYLMS
ncbi:MAG: hypothetical protein GOP50_03875 [Candidatus Heimdallarchaeota archaeon]|nr:hypothetical protein [Candidatus Heimdallarchaeota archaeon]